MERCDNRTGMTTKASPVLTLADATLAVTLSIKQARRMHVHNRLSLPFQAEWMFALSAMGVTHHIVPEG